MAMLLRFAWRNIWRNRRRTVITLLALSFGVMAIVTMHSFREAANAAMFRNITAGLVGHAQVSARGYHDSPETSQVVKQPAAVAARLRAAVPGATTAQRGRGGGRAGAGEAASPVTILGIQPDNPGAAGLLQIQAGRSLGSAAGNEVVIGTGLATELGGGPGDELVLVGQATDGSLANDRYTVVGTADAGSHEANATTVFLHLEASQSFFVLGDAVHLIVVRLPVEAEALARPLASLREAAGLDALEVLGWTEILPELESATNAKRQNSRVLDFIVFLIVALGVLNTMTMSTFERTREFGMLASLGTRRRRILGMVLLEALLQGALGFFIGTGLAAVVLYGIGTVDLSSVVGDADVLGARLSGAIELAVLPEAVRGAAVVTVLTMIAGGVLPAVRASRLKPVEATRYV